MDKIERMRAFALVAREGSFTAAGQRLGLSTRLVSKYVADLEASLDARLLNRTTRSVSLTDTGALYLARCEPLLDGFDELAELVKTAETSLKGPIRITAPTGFGALRLAPSLATFAALHDEVEVDLQLSDRRIDIVEEGVDLAIRIGPMRDSSLIAKRLTDMPLFLCASPAYVVERGEPAQPGDLAGHDCIVDNLVDTPAIWRFAMGGEEIGVRVAGRLRANAPAAAARFAIAGLGVARCPVYTAAEALRRGDLVELLPGYRPRPFTVAALYAPGRRLTTRLRALIDHLAADETITRSGVV